MAKKSFLVKTVLMSMLTAVTFSFTSCQDDILDPDMAPQTEKAITRGAESTGYNINDHNASKGATNYQPFNRKDWRSQQSVFLYVGGAGGQDIKGWENGLNLSRHGYELQNLPWAKKGGPNSYIPKAIIDDLQEDPSWQLVLLQAGSDATKNGNYLGFYHKYRGILRILTFMKPGGQNITNHMWGISMGDEMASHSVFGYALPKDKVGMLENSKRVLNMNDWMNKTVTPMMNRSTWDNPDGSIQPNEGWWSFDIDLSVYNPDADVTKAAANDMMLSLNPLGYATDSYEFSSAMKAAASGDINLEQCQAASDGSVIGSFLKGLDVVAKVAEFAGKCAEGDVAGAISGGVELAKTGCEIAGISTDENSNNYKGDIHFDMSGTITTTGTKSTPVIFNEMPAAALKLADFDFSGNDNTFGQGVWNLETAPVVYCTNAETNWIEKSYWKSYANEGRGLSCTQWQPLAKVFSPFGGIGVSWEKSDKPWHGLVCFFDPSSVKVSLNPQVFTPNEIGRAKVSAVCGVRKGTDFSRYEQYRTIQKLQSAKHHVNDTYQFPNRYTGEAPFNAYGLGVNKFSADPVDNNEVGYIGGGDSDYLIEPVGLRGQKDENWGDYYLPTYEVTVTVTIPLDAGKTVVLSRTYLPEFKDIDAMQVESYYNKLKNGAIGMPAHYQGNVYKGQVERIGKLSHWIRTTPIAIIGSPIDLADNSRIDDGKLSFSRVIDGDKNSKWASHVTNKYIKGKAEYQTKTVEKNCDHNCWFAEFKIYSKEKAKSFTLTSSNTGDNKKPRSVRFFARNDNQGEWVQLYYQNNIQMPSGQNTEMTFNIPSNVQGNYNTYRFEVVDNWGGDYLDLNELTMNWAE
ncbi:MAG: hypothetical protein IJ907_08335 [Prevotella sp.]|nr:hypothetical protein [Prevotella sp.]MBR2097865.1 hypothetical protein [Prevotella sp.]